LRCGDGANIEVENTINVLAPVALAFILHEEETCKYTYNTFYKGINTKLLTLPRVLSPLSHEECLKIIKINLSTKKLPFKPFLSSCAPARTWPCVSHSRRQE